jgi:hypothetical protein
MYHVLLLFPLSQQPWKVRCQSWASKNPLQEREWIFGMGHIVGVLNSDLLRVKPPNYDDMPILVIIPSEWQIMGRLQLEGAPPPPYIETQQPINPNTPSSQNKPKSRRYGTSTSPEQTRQTGTVHPLRSNCNSICTELVADQSHLRPIVPAKAKNTSKTAR